MLPQQNRIKVSACSCRCFCFSHQPVSANTNVDPLPPATALPCQTLQCAVPPHTLPSSPLTAHLLQEVCHALPEGCLSWPFRPLWVVLGQQVQQLLWQVAGMQEAPEGVLVVKLCPTKLPDLPGALVLQAPDSLHQHILQGHLHTKLNQISPSLNCRTSAGQCVRCGSNRSGHDTEVYQTCSALAPMLLLGWP